MRALCVSADARIGPKASRAVVRRSKALPAVDDFAVPRDLILFVGVDDMVAGAAVDLVLLGSERHRRQTQRTDPSVIKSHLPPI